MSHEGPLLAHAPVVELSIIVPAYNEEDNVEPLYRAILATVPALGRPFELIFVDDGSIDGTFARLTGLAAQDSRIRVIKLRRNYGQTPAMVAGIDYARGRILITMDADLQNDPTDIPRLVNKIRDGYDIVVGWRHDRQDKWLSRRLPSVVANRLIAKVTGVDVKDNGCTLKAYRAELIRWVPLYGDMHRFIPAMASIPGCHLAELKVHHHPRRFGRSKYGMSRIWKVLIDMITIKTLLTFAQRPLFCFLNSAMVAMALSTIYGLLALHGSMSGGGTPSIVFTNVAILFGSLAIFLSLIGMTGALIHQLTDGEAWSGGGFGEAGRDGGPQPMVLEPSETVVSSAELVPGEKLDILSVVVPVLPDGGSNLSAAHRLYRAALARRARELEFVYVVGRENAVALVELSRLKEAGDPLTAIVLERWDGEGNALHRGVRRTRGEVVLTLPAHLQVAPEELPKILAALPGHDMAVARRQTAGVRIDTVEANVFHWLVAKLFGRSFKDLVCRVRAGRRQVFEEIAGHGVPQHFLPLVAAERGFRLAEVPVRAGPQTQGGRGGPLGKLFARFHLGLDVLALYTVLRFIRRPLRFFGAIGLPILFAGLLLTGVLVTARLFFEVSLADRPILILGVLLIVLGIQVIALGLIGEIIVFAAGRRIENYTVERLL
jgi:glycosyltransferase involved in cell wall biosynthesis